VADRLRSVVRAIALFVERGLVALRPSRRRQRRFCRSEARRRFHWEREHLEAKFVGLAQVSHNRGTPRWADCDFGDEVTYVRNRRTGQFLALVAITVTLGGRASAIDSLLGGGGSGRELSTEPPFAAIKSIRSATAVFRFDGSHWTTDGSPLFNLSPAEAIRFYRHDLEFVADEDPALTRSASEEDRAE
jgi:hypothetical protein